MNLRHIKRLRQEQNDVLCLTYERVKLGFPHSSVGKESSCKAGDLGLIPGSGRSSGEGNGSEGNTDSSILAWRIPWTEELAGYSPWDCKSRS